jgi:hypothetical protein
MSRDAVEVVDGQRQVERITETDDAVRQKQRRHGPLMIAALNCSPAIRRISSCTTTNFFVARQPDAY